MLHIFNSLIEPNPEHTEEFGLLIGLYIYEYILRNKRPFKIYRATKFIPCNNARVVFFTKIPSPCNSR